MQLLFTAALDESNWSQFTSVQFKAVQERERERRISKLLFEKNERIC